MIYFNVAGLAPFNPIIQQEVSKTLDKFGQLLYSNEGIQYYRETAQRCRQQLAQWLQVDDCQNLALVPNATTANWLVLSRIAWRPGDHILTTTHENSTVLKEILGLQRHGVQVQTISPSSPVELENRIKHLLESIQVRALVMSHISHIDGRIFPVERITQLTQHYGTLFIVDGAQAVGHIPVHFQHWQPDAYFFPGHKWLGGPMGTGALVLGKGFSHCNDKWAITEKRENCQPPWIDYELGTHHIGLIAGLAKACTVKQQEGLKNERLERIKGELRGKLLKNPRCQVLEWAGPHSPGILSLTSKEKQLADQDQSHGISWKTFQSPEHPEDIGIRLSWNSNTSPSDIEVLKGYLQNME